jgi:hypothetical protein
MRDDEEAMATTPEIPTIHRRSGFSLPLPIFLRQCSCLFELFAGKFSILTIVIFIPSGMAFRSTRKSPL